VARGGDRPGLRLTRFRPDLSLVGETCFGIAGPRELALTATPTGYLLAARAGSGTLLYALGPDGAPRGPARFEHSRYWPSLIARPEGGALLAWMIGNGDIEAVLIRSDGSPEAAPVRVFARAEPWPGIPSAVHVGDGFLLAAHEGGTGVVAARLGPDGRLTRRTLISDVTLTHPQLAWTGTEARMVMIEADPRTGNVTHVRLDREGKPLGLAATLAAGQLRFTTAPIAAFGADTVALILRPGLAPGDPGRPTMDVARIGAGGAFVGSPIRVTHDPNAPSSHRIARWREEVIVAWTSGALDPTRGSPLGRIGLARVRP
jgi:hypothetical protein